MSVPEPVPEIIAVYRRPGLQSQDESTAGDRLRLGEYGEAKPDCYVLMPTGSVICVWTGV